MDVEVLGAEQLEADQVSRFVHALKNRYGKHLHSIEFSKDDVTVVLLNPPDVVFLSYVQLEELMKKR